MDSKDQLDLIFQRVADKVNWKNYEVSTNINHEKGNGFLGEFFLASITNKDSHEKIDLAIKCAFKNQERRKEVNIPIAFQNEIYLYDTIIPTLFKFADEKQCRGKFDFIVEFYASIKEDCSETIAMENIRTNGYQCVDRHKLLDEEHVSYVFRTYGKFHGLTFAFKDQKPKDYKVMMEKATDLIKYFENSKATNNFGETMKSACADAFSTVDENIKAACKSYIENPIDIYLKYYNHYQGNNSSLIHGDCWSNNMMFKYKDSRLDAMKLIDFQLVKDGSPVYDLSYFLYAGGSCETYENLDKYLKIYYESFSKTVRELGSDPEKLLTWADLKSDWKIYSKTGLLMGILINKIKLLDTSDVDTMVEGAEFIGKMGTIKLNDDLMETFKRRCKSLIEHTYKEGYLELA